MAETLHWTAGIHHDSSLLYVSNPLPESGETVTVSLRVPAQAPVRRVYLRTVPDGEEAYTEMSPARRDMMSVWWEGQVKITMPCNPYRFRVLADTGVYYVNALGVSQAKNIDLFDFKLLANYQAPRWVHDSVLYHIFVDRFYNGDPASDVPDGAWSRGTFTTKKREWGAPLLPYTESGSLDFYGGDLPGIAQKLDYLLDLGVNTVFLSPIFTALTYHRYDTTDFYTVDPHVGGDAALADLRRALDRAGMRVVLDIVVNHCGNGHPWFTEAQTDLNARTAEYFTFYEHPQQYASWLGHASLVKLNYRSEALRDCVFRMPDSVMRHWMHEPYRIDGWRLDVFNMMARQGEIRFEHEIGEQMRQALKADNPEIYLYGEHFFDPTPHLQGDEVDGTMNYQGFTMPLRHWLAGDRGTDWTIPDRTLESLPAEVLAEQWTNMRAAVPWAVQCQQYNALDSHDIPRILSMIPDKALEKLGVVFLMTYPGVPGIYYGDEIGMDGGKDPDNRRCMEWDQSKWDHDLRAHYQKLIKLRRTAPALVDGGYQGLYARGGVIAYQRQSAEQQLIVIGYRGLEVLPNLSLPVWHAGLSDATRLIDLLGSGTYTVENGHLALNNLPRGAALILETQR